MTLVDEDNRRRAMTDFTSILLVEAAAGTGKTSLMAGRVAMMLASGHSPGDIAAITFTELAASQLAHRIRNTVEELLRGTVPEFIKSVIPNGLTTAQRVSLEAAAPRLDELTTTTIHGFCQAIIRSHGVQAGLDPGASIVDAAVADTLFLDELSAWFSHRLAADAAEGDPIVVLAEEMPLEVVALIRELALLRRKHPDASPISAPDNIRPDIAFVQAVEDFDRFQSSMGSEAYARGIAEELRRLAARYSDVFARTPDFATLWRLCDAGRCRLFTRRGLQLMAYEDATEAFGAYSGEGGNLGVIAQYEAVNNAWSELIGHIAGTLVCTLASSLDQLLASYRDRKRAAAVLDFDDLLLHVRH
ncbi:MAG TPA: UvrD-helicase domain-containing protein, partial [Bradyrhizobium sp.]|nr:UvrD-helicase domain-containing protein [Bradyrhizobium sp.]